MLDNSCETELQGWYDFAVVDEVNIDQMIESKCHPLLTRWVHVWKKDQYGTKSLKSRLVIKGFQEDQSQLRTYSPTVAREMVVLCLTIFSSKTWNVRTMDVKQAFLQSDELQRAVYVIPPKEADLSPETIWRLKTAVYGLADASRQWCFTAKRDLIDELGLFQMKLEQAVFDGLDREGNLNGILLMHVDDFLYAGSEGFIKKVEKIKQTVKIGKVQSGSVTFCGLNIQRNGVNLEVSSKEVDSIEPCQHIPVGEQKFMPLTAQEERRVRSVIGSLQWSATANRPDLSYHLAMALGELNKNNDRRSIITANNLLMKYQKHENHKLSIVPMNLDNLVLQTHRDSAFQISNQQGIVSLLRENSNSSKVNFLSWKSKRAERRTWSTLAAETHALQKKPLLKRCITNAF